VAVQPTLSAAHAHPPIATDGAPANGTVSKLPTSVAAAS
jgi:hypothetical protein